MQQFRTIAIGSTAQYALVSARAMISARARIRRGTSITIAVAVLHPFPYVPENVIQTERIRTETANRRCVIPKIPALLFAATALVATVVRAIMANTVAPEVAGASHVFPFRFTEQPIFFTRLSTEPLHERLGVNPTDANDRLSVGLTESWISPGRTASRVPRTTLVVLTFVPGVVASCTNKLTELRTGNLVGTYRKTVRNRDMALRKLIAFLASLARRRTHLKRAGRHNNHLRTVGTICKRRTSAYHTGKDHVAQHKHERKLMTPAGSRPHDAATTALKKSLSAITSAPFGFDLALHTTITTCLLGLT